MKTPQFRLPSLNDPLPAPAPCSSEIADFLATRRSTPIKTFEPDAPGPDTDTLTSLIRTAMRVPDHRKLGPWRTLIISGNARLALGDTLAARFRELNPGAAAADIETERSRLLRAPVCVIVVSSPVDDGKTPVWEQELSAGALCMNLLYAVHAAGYAASWLSEWWAYDDVVNAALGLLPVERIAGNIFIGKSQTDLFERPRAEPDTRISVWTAVP